MFNISDYITRIPEDIFSLFTVIFPNAAAWLVDNLWLIKTISGIFSAILIVGCIYLAYKIQYLNDRIERWMDSLMVGNLSKHRSLRVWRFILGHLRSRRPEDWKEAVNKADAVLDEILKVSGYPGDNLDERLAEITAAQIANISELRHAHALANKIKKEPDYLPERQTVEEALYVYRRTFQELRLLD